MGCTSPSVVSGLTVVGTLVGRAGPSPVGSQALPRAVAAGPLLEGTGSLCGWLHSLWNAWTGAQGGWLHGLGCPGYWPTGGQISLQH